MPPVLWAAVEAPSFMVLGPGMSGNHFFYFGTGTGKVRLRSSRMGWEQENPNSFLAVLDGNGKKPNVIPVVWDDKGTSQIVFPRFRKAIDVCSEI